MGSSRFLKTMKVVLLALAMLVPYNAKSSENLPRKESGVVRNVADLVKDNFSSSRSIRNSFGSGIIYESTIRLDEEEIVVKYTDMLNSMNEDVLRIYSNKYGRGRYSFIDIGLDGSLEGARVPEYEFNSLDSKKRGETRKNLYFGKLREIIRELR